MGVGIDGGGVGGGGRGGRTRAHIFARHTVAAAVQSRNKGRLRRGDEVLPSTGAIAEIAPLPKVAPIYFFRFSFHPTDPQPSPDQLIFILINTPIFSFSARGWGWVGRGGGGHILRQLIKQAPAGGKRSTFTTGGW